MISKHSLLLFSVIILFTHLSKAQVKTKTFARGIPDNVIPVKEIAGREYKILPLAEFNSLKILANKNMSLADRSRFALSTPVNINILKEATLIKTGTTAIYYFTLKAIDAFNISVQFNKFILSKNSLLSIYNKTELTDSITAEENNETDTWSTRVYQGNTLHIVLNIPLEELGQSTLNLGFVYFGYKKTGFTPHFGAPGASDPCQVNVACPAGNGWNNERNSVALINANGHWATGVLVMNTCGTNRPYLLTANHNLSVGNVQNWVFQFLFYSTDCNTDIGYREDIQITGCTVRASNGASDFALLELNQTPPVNSGIHYAGWSRDSNPFSITSTTFLHHPAGDVLKISVDVGSPVQAPAGAIQCWRLALNSGGDQGGSSGGPYFNQQHRIIGQHYGVPTEHVDEPCHPEKYGGRFDLSWTGGGTNSTRLSNWLDPNNSGATTTNTTNISALFSWNPSLTMIGSPTNDYICTGSSTYSLSEFPGNATVSWTVSNSLIASIPNPSTGSSVVVTKQNNGVVTLTANVTLCGGETRTVNKTLMIGAAIDGYYRIASDYHNYGIFNPLYNNNSPIWLPANKTCGVDVWLTSPTIQSATWSRAGTSYPFNWNTSGTFLSFAGTSGASAYVERKGIFNISAQTSCGTYNGTYNWPVIVQGWGLFTITTSPNPANDLITVNISEESPDVKALSSNENVTIEMYSFNQTMLIKTWRFKNDHKQFSLNIADINKGQYILVVKKGKFKESKQILIE